MHAAARSLESVGGDHLCPGKPWRGVGAPPATVRVVGSHLHRQLHRGGAPSPGNRVGVASVRRFDGDARNGGHRRPHPPAEGGGGPSENVVVGRGPGTPTSATAGGFPCPPIQGPAPPPPPPPPPPP